MHFDIIIFRLVIYKIRPSSTWLSFCYYYKKPRKNMNKFINFNYARKCINYDRFCISLPIGLVWTWLELDMQLDIIIVGLVIYKISPN